MFFLCQRVCFSMFTVRQWKLMHSAAIRSISSLTKNQNWREFRTKRLCELVQIWLIKPEKDLQTNTHSKRSAGGRYWIYSWEYFWPNEVNDKKHWKGQIQEKTKKVKRKKWRKQKQYWKQQTCWLISTESKGKRIHSDAIFLINFYITTN